MDLNKLNDYYFKETRENQYLKLMEELQELQWEIKQNNFENIIQEGFDLMLATLNLIKKYGATEKDYKRHLEKLERYKKTKYEVIE